MTAPQSQTNPYENSPLISNNFYWIGGSPCSGKSSVADALAARYNLTVYHCDNYLPDHLERANPQAQPTIARLPHMNCDEIWLVPVAEQIQRVFQIYAEEFPMFQSDLAELFGTVIVEGAGLLPNQLHDLVSSLKQVIYLIPSRKFQFVHYSQREWRHDVLKDCSDSDLAFQNWMERDQQYAAQIKEDARKYRFTCLTVDETHDLEYFIERTAQHFALR